MIRKVTVVSYGTGNLASLADAFRLAGADAIVARSAEELRRASALVLPGVGHFGAALEVLRASALLEEIGALIRNGVPTLGICLGFQLLTQSSEEANGASGLSIFPCHTARMRPAAPDRFKVPHLGWNGLHRVVGECRLLKGIPAEEQLFYYANAYAVAANAAPSQAFATYEHGDEYLALVEQGNVFGVQFHPEKSRGQGIRLLKNFLES